MVAESSAIRTRCIRGPRKVEKYRLYVIWLAGNRSKSMARGTYGPARPLADSPLPSTPVSVRTVFDVHEWQNRDTNRFRRRRDRRHLPRYQPFAEGREAAARRSGHCRLSLRSKPMFSEKQRRCVAGYLLKAE